MEDGSILPRTSTYWIAASWNRPRVDFNPGRYLASLRERFTRFVSGRSRSVSGIQIRSWRCVACGYLESCAAADSDSAGQRPSV